MLSVSQLQDEVRRLLGNEIMQISTDLGELSVKVARTRIADILRLLRDDPAIAMSQLVDICGADYPDRPERFEIIYHLLSLRHNARLRVKIETAEQTPVPSVIGVYSAAGWFERECWDMFGVAFSGNPDMRRILTDYGFEGHPLRKDFPLSGYVEVRYDETLSRVVYEPVSLPQDFRSFDFLSPWEGMTTVQEVAPFGAERAGIKVQMPVLLPGDEKATNPAPVKEAK